MTFQNSGNSIYLYYIILFDMFICCFYYFQGLKWKNLSLPCNSLIHRHGPLSPALHFCWLVHGVALRVLLHHGILRANHSTRHHIVRGAATCSHKWRVPLLAHTCNHKSDFSLQCNKKEQIMPLWIDKE